MLELFVSSFVTFFVVIDPPGCAPIFAGLTAGATAAHRRAMAVRAVIVSAIILLVFALDILLFLTAAETWGLTPIVPTAALRILSWLSVAAATVYMGWMAVYYSSVTALRDEM